MISLTTSTENSFENLTSILKPENYTALYARHSIDRKESVSNESQFTVCRAIAKSKNLIVYKEYGDQGSGIVFAPEMRDEFKKLLVDAKSGLFKTIIIWKIDRLSRNPSDFYDICKKLKSMGIKVIFGDMLGFESVPEMYRSFMENTFISLAQLQPELIREAANASRAKKRELGIYSPTKCPFGYIRKKFNTVLNLSIDTEIDTTKIKSYYVKDEFKSKLIEIIYAKYTSNTSVTIHDIYSVFSSLLKKSNNITDINNLDILNNLISDSDEMALPGLNDAFSLLRNYDGSELKELVTNSLKYLSKHNNIQSILTKTFYCKKSVLNTDKDYPSFITDSTNNIIFNNYDYVDCVNFDEIIPLSLFVTANIKYYANKNHNVTPTKFLYKGIFKCKYCKKAIKSYDNNTYNCSCNTYSKSTLLSFLTNRLISDGFLKFISDRVRFKRKEISNKVNQIHSQIIEKEKVQHRYCRAYLDTNSKANALALNRIAKEIKTLKTKIENFLLKDYPLNNLLFNIEHLVDTSTIEELMINYFYVNETNSELFFNQLIKSVVVSKECCKIEYN